MKLYTSIFSEEEHFVKQTSSRMDEKYDSGFFIYARG